MTTDEAFFSQSTPEILYIDYKNLPKIVSRGNRVFIDDGLISLIVKEVRSSLVVCEVENGGVLGTQKGVNLPGIATDLPPVSEKDKQDLLFGVEHDVDMVFASFIRNSAGIQAVRDVLGNNNYFSGFFYHTYDFVD